MTTQNIKQHSECTYKALKNRLRILLNDLEARCEVKGCAEDKSESENVTKLEVNNRDCSKQSKKIELLHDDLQMIINNLEEIKKTTYERSSDSYLYAAMSEQVFMKQAHLNELERRHAFLCNSLKSMRQELNLSFNKQPNSHLCFKVGDCNSNSCVKIQKKLNTLKEKCDTMRREQRQLLDYCSSNPVYLETYADNYSNQYNDLLQIYAIMEISEEEEKEPSAYIVALLYALLSFVIVLLLVFIISIVCFKKYRLNWFEKNLLESADNKVSSSQEELVQELIHENKCPKSVEEESFCQSDIDKDDISLDHSAADSLVLTYNEHPISPPFAFARDHKQILLSNTSPVRPKVTSMQSKLDHTKIDSSLYQKESPDELENVRGSIHIVLSYDPVDEILIVKLLEAHDLEARDFSGTADPYAKIRLLPDRTNVWQTRIHKKTLNPVFDEDFVFDVKSASLNQHTLEVLLYNFDAYSRHSSIGGVHISLTNLDLNNKVDCWKGLCPTIESDARLDLGELMISLAYLPSAERLTVVVIKARNLRIVDDTRNSSDPYVKVSIIQGDKRIKKRKTGVHRNTTSPIFNEALIFNINKAQLKRCYIEFNVMHDSLLGASELLGKARLGQTNECKGREREYFAEIFRNSTASSLWLPLSDPRIII
ncbi:hypothetical protein FQR65_LT12663 [Abscondita terminalis]|nr:hypothetical protein FQR65_LT12663 [Abscondita terminalis]